MPVSATVAGGVIPPGSPFDTEGARRAFRGIALVLFGLELLMSGQVILEYGMETLFPTPKS